MAGVRDARSAPSVLDAMDGCRRGRCCTGRRLDRHARAPGSPSRAAYDSPGGRCGPRRLLRGAGRLAAAGLSLRLGVFPAAGQEADPHSAPSVRGPRTAALALALVSAALSAVLFLLVILLVSGGGLSPLHAALELSILPGAAILAAR